MGELFIKDVAEFNEKVNALVAIESFSGYVEGFLVSKSNRPECNEKLFEGPVAQKLLKNDPHILCFHQEVQQLISRGECRDKDDLYHKLILLFQSLEDGRQMDTLPLSPLPMPI